MHSLGDVNKIHPLELVRLEKREDYTWCMEFRRNGFTFFKIIPDAELIQPDDFRDFINSIIKETLNG